MNIPSHLLEDEKRQINYPKSLFTWISVGAAGVTLVPFVFFVIDLLIACLIATSSLIF